MGNAQGAENIVVNVQLTRQQIQQLAAGRSVDVTIHLTPPESGAKQEKTGFMDTGFGNATSWTADSADAGFGDASSGDTGSLTTDSASTSSTHTASFDAYDATQQIHVAGPTDTYDTDADGNANINSSYGDDAIGGIAGNAVDKDVDKAANEAADEGKNTEETTQEPPVTRRAIISMDSTSTEAETLFRSAIVSIDGIPGNQVDGISPLYHVSELDGPDSMSAVVMVSTRLGARQLVASLGTIEATHADQLSLKLIDMEGVSCSGPDCTVPWPSASHKAAVLAPWMDMDPEARLGNDPVSFLLAMAPDATRVGMLSDNWIIGGTL